MVCFGFLLLGLAAVSALPADPIISRPSGPRYQYVEGSDGSVHLVDLWVKLSDLQEAARYNPDSENAYHLFTRQNPSVSQPIVFGLTDLLSQSNFNANRRTILIVHGWMGDTTSSINSMLVPAFLGVEDLNVIVVDWNAGAGTVNYIAAALNTVSSGVSVARFVDWLNQVTGATASSYHMVGHSLGAHQAGIVSRNIQGNVPYLTGLDPALPMFLNNDDKIGSSDALYTEIIHTNAGLLGFESNLGDVDFYPNGGNNMPGCVLPTCDHSRSYHYMAETLSSGGFTGIRCNTYSEALSGDCHLSETLNMGGLVPKTGKSGIYWLQTNASPPYSQG